MANNKDLPTGYIPNRPMKEIEQDFRKGGFGSVADFIKNNFTKEQSNSIATIPVTPGKINQLKSISFQYLNDSGSGRIGSGVLSLEAITKVLKGVPIHALTLFDQVIYTNPSEFNTNNQNDLRQAVYTNLGMTEFVPSASLVSPESITNLNLAVDAMIKDMKNFTFTYDNYINTALAVCKGVVQAAIKFNGV
jgi:hypothetical protein